MRGFFKLFLPPLIAFLIFAGAIRIDALYHHFRFEQISDGTLHSLMAYFYFFWPLLSLDALLTQGVIIIPLWNRLKHAKPGSKTIAIIILILICLIFSLGVSFMMYGSTTYLHYWMRSFAVMLAVQLSYWFVVLTMLGILDRKKAEMQTVKADEAA